MGTEAVAAVVLLPARRLHASLTREDHAVTACRELMQAARHGAVDGGWSRRRLVGTYSQRGAAPAPRRYPGATNDLWTSDFGPCCRGLGLPIRRMRPS